MDSTIAIAEPSPSGAGSGTKRRRNVAKACENCRRRRAKCDGVQPECGTCRGYRDECHWDSKADSRRLASRQQMDAMRARVADLERLLERTGVNPPRDGSSINSSGVRISHGIGTGHRRRRSSFPDEEDEDEDESSDRDGDDKDERPNMSNHIVESQGGDLHFHGPVSAFHHISKSPIASGLYPHINASFTSIQLQAPDHGKHLPKEVFLTARQHDTALDRFFRFHASWCQRITRHLFERDLQRAMSQGSSPINHYSPLLHNAILSIALCYADEEHLRFPGTRRVFAQQAKTYIDQESSSPTVATVQGLASLSSYHSLEGEHNLGWTYMGQASRLSQALGLHLDPSALSGSGKLTASEARERVVVFWSTFSQETAWSPYIGRVGSQIEYTTALPVADPATNDLEWAPLDGVDSVRAGPCHISTTFVETVKLLRIGQDIMNSLYSIKANVSAIGRSGLVSEISLALTTWKDELPSAVILTGHSDSNAYPHVIMMHITHMWLIILLQRPFYRKVSPIPGSSSEQISESVKQCDRSAVRIVTLLQMWHRLYNLRFTTPTALQAAFTAGTTFLLSAVQTRAPKRRRAAINGVKDCVAMLGHMGRSWSAARQKAEILEALAADYGVRSPEPSDARASGGPTSIAAEHTSPRSVVPPANSGDLYAQGHAQPLPDHDLPSSADLRTHNSDHRIFEGNGQFGPIAEPHQEEPFDLPSGFDFLDDPDSQALQMLLDRVSVPHTQLFPFQPGLLSSNGFQFGPGETAEPVAVPWYLPPGHFQGSRF